MKTRLGRYLAGVESDAMEYLITRHERPVALLVPVRTGRGTRAAALRRLATGSVRRKADNWTTKQLIEAGRK
ncbi:hypothetical protein AW736_26355 [Termitidicoccus mucosus]|uniref:Prevent-host-death protein n=2 Tax=Termitidicoccus mucosus TaxID=1184151 RepID=A0A178IR42_9BACT|nr:hypothetical protein AW736_26355 [Opitutaceae bacterium TSB47]